MVKRLCPVCAHVTNPPSLTIYLFPLLSRGERFPNIDKVSSSAWNEGSRLKLCAEGGLAMKVGPCTPPLGLTNGCKHTERSVVLDALSIRRNRRHRYSPAPAQAKFCPLLSPDQLSCSL